jgi:UPF0271 protein
VQIDLNADLGEGFGIWRLGDDRALLDVVTSANIACGFHAGDPTIMRTTCEMAIERGVAIGAQVGYRDLAGFGRRAIAIAPDDLAADVLYQLGALDAFARAAGDRIRYLKPHGALYHAAASDQAIARAVVRAAREFSPTLPVLGLPASALLTQCAAAGLRGVPEAFADRAYTAAGGLVARDVPGAIVHEPDAVARRSLELVVSGHIRAQDGTSVAVRAESLCLHGDTPGAVELARLVRRTLEMSGIEITSFA